jgi:hypothetical protein
MPLACLTAVAGGVSVGPGVRTGFVVSAIDSTLGQRARGLRLPAARILGVASAHTADSPSAFCGLRRDAEGWQLWNQANGWQAVQLRPDSLALPLIVVLSFQVCAGNGGSDRSACQGTHRRRICIDACECGSNSADVGGRHQNSVERFRQHVRIVEGVMQTATFLALHG